MNHRIMNLFSIWQQQGYYRLRGVQLLSNANDLWRFPNIFCSCSSIKMRVSGMVAIRIYALPTRPKTKLFFIIYQGEKFFNKISSRSKKNSSKRFSIENVFFISLENNSRWRRKLKSAWHALLQHIIFFQSHFPFWFLLIF